MGTAIPVWLYYISPIYYWVKLRDFWWHNTHMLIISSACVLWCSLLYANTFCLKNESSNSSDTSKYPDQSYRTSYAIHHCIVTWGKFDRAAVICSALDLAKIGKVCFGYQFTVYHKNAGHETCIVLAVMCPTCALNSNWNSWLCYPGDHAIIKKENSYYIDKGHVRYMDRVLVCYGIKSRIMHLINRHNISLGKDPFLYRPKKMFHLWYLPSFIATLGLYSLSFKTFYRQISWTLEAARLDAIMIVPHWHLIGTSAALLPGCLSNFRSIGKV